MEVQEYQLENITSFEPRHIFDCGQCFRWNKEQDGSYTGVIKNGVLNVKKEEKTIYFQGICEGNIKEICTGYFDLKRDYEVIKKMLSKVDDHLAKSIQYGAGIRILNQDLWETIISFIISANNNIPRIKGIIERLSQQYGRRIDWREKQYYTFPTVQELSRASIQDLRDLGLGFRDTYVFETTQKILNAKVCFSDFYQKSTIEVRKELISLPGVGPKVADCILLFSDLKRFEVFPIDVWVRRVINELYFQREESMLSKKEIEKLAKEKYGDLAGLAQQYLFYWKRDTA